ncbi:MAG: hypothetical protein BWY35_00654 [Firmicutes bacterium ADurb.Bin248]|nr:MAG: hypothetical protein BWY35_00654 [Firmicutes bacterium ADurb.Bin248]
MKFLKNAAQWVSSQFRAHTARSLAIALAVPALVAAGALWACGVFSAEAFSYLPERAYILAPGESADPQSLAELLHGGAPEVDALLRNPSIAGELLRAETLTDIVDSRLALNNLRSLDRELSARLEEVRETERTLGLSSAKYGAEASAAPLAARRHGAAAVPLSLPGLLERQAGTLARLKAATEKLLAPPAYDELVALAPTVNMKGVWQSPDEALIHMVPSGDWLPEEGYKLYRVVNGESVLIAEHLASPAEGLSGSLGADDAELIRSLYAQAELTPEKLALLGMGGEDEFRALAYRADTLARRPRVGGEVDFQAMEKALRTIPAGVGQKIPETDLLLGTPIQVLGRQENGAFCAAALRAWVFETFSVIQDQTETGIDALKSLPGGQAKYDLALEILAARQQLVTLGFVDDAYAEAAGFLFRDDLSGLNLADGVEIVYLAESPEGAKSSVSVTRGTGMALTKPQGLMGYGIDGSVPLRWQQAQSQEERAVVSGYLIERRREGESGFTQINEAPVAVSYMLDETGVYFESPVFYEDALENGKSAEYRVRAIDVFGRVSEYSDPISVTAEKVTPPNAPSVEAPALSDDAGNASEAVQDSVALNPGKRGIVLPVFTDSADTVRFTVYRAKAVGANGFGQPEPIANIAYDNPKNNTSGNSAAASADASAVTVRKKHNKASQLLLSRAAAYPDFVYFDADVEAGCTYKYWISAWDSWNNESAWSQSVSVGVPTAAEPESPAALRVAMHCRALPDYSREAPGLLHEDLVSFEELAQKGLPGRVYPKGVDTGTIERAEEYGVCIGSFLTDGALPPVIDKLYDNLPEEKYIHMFLAVRGEDVLPDGTARLKWPAYGGDGFGGYAVYRADFVLAPLDELQGLSRAELARLGLWRRVNDAALNKNRLVVDGLDGTPGSLALFLVCLEPEAPEKLDFPLTPGAAPGVELDIASRFADIPEGGYVYVDWDAPDDPQVAYYRVYRSELPSFEGEIDEAALKWTLVGDRIAAPQFTERVEQSFAHYYYYKVASVSPWGVEAALGAVQRFRVPSTKPPQTPNLLLPLSTKDGVEINFSAVDHCARYEIYRTAIPVVSEALLGSLLERNSKLFAALFETPSKKDLFLTGMLTNALSLGGAAASADEINPLGRFRTLSRLSNADILGNLTKLGDASGLSAYNEVLNAFGPLALAEYRDLSVEMMKRVKWVKVGEMPAVGAAEAVDPATGLLKPLSFTDTTAEYGVMYLYTVQAWNDDNLGSTRAEPVEATPRRNGPFDPIKGLAGKIEGGKPHLTWNAPAMANLTPEQCRETTVGYIVYRADQQDGTYYQASPLLFTTQWTDEEADPSAFNWYKVRVLDTGGYLSEFSQPLLVRLSFSPGLDTVIPEPVAAPAQITVGDGFSVLTGEEFHTAYGLTGAEPIEVTVQATDRAGKPVAGFTVDAASRTVRAPSGLTPGMYRVTLTAKNGAGESAASFLLEVRAKEADAPPEIAARLDEYRFTMSRQLAFAVQLYASGSEPLSWSLEPVNAYTPVPAGASVDGAGNLSVAAGIPTGSYSFVVRVSNAFGFDTQEVSLEVISLSMPVVPIVPNLPVNPNLNTAPPVTLAPSGKPTPSPAASPKPSGTASEGKLHFDHIKCMGFTLRDVNLYAAQLGATGTTGSALLDVGYEEPVPVSIMQAALEKKGNEIVLTAGAVYLAEPFPLGSIGVTLVSLEISPLKSRAVVSGYVKSTVENQNLTGDLFALEFKDALLKNGSIVVQDGLPDIRYEQFTIHDIGELWIKLNGKQTGAKAFISLVDSGISMKSHLETLDNEGLEFEEASALTFDLAGRISGTIYAWDEQCLQLLVPGGAALRVEAASIIFADGEVKPAGEFVGKLVLPFEKHDVYGEGVPGVYAGTHPETNEMDALAAGGSVSAQTKNALYAGLLRFGGTVQQNGLLILPEDFALQDKCSSVPIELHDWDGEGFLIESSAMTPARVTERSLTAEKQRAQAVVVAPSAVRVDLDRDASFPKQANSQTPNETEKAFWVGLVAEGGTLTLPPDFVKSAQGKPIDFALAEGELIYDLNGFNYQTYLYNPNGVPAEFGEALGGFTDVLVYDCMLDLYANRVNLEINAEVAVDLFLGNRVKVKLYTNQEDNADGKKGEFLCSVAPAAVEDALANGVDLNIGGGWVKPEGMHINGDLTLETAEVQTGDPLAFTDMLVPSDILDTLEENNPGRQYASAALDKPVNVSFQGFTMEVRALDLAYMDNPDYRSVYLALRGATLLAESIPLSQDTTDDLVVDCPGYPLVGYGLNYAALDPYVVYGESRAVLNATFDDCIDVSGVLVPKLTASGEAAKNMARSGNTGAGPALLSANAPSASSSAALRSAASPGEGLVEFDADQLQLSFLKQLGSLPVKTETRFGFDLNRNRCYFAVGLVQDGSGTPIEFGAGEIDDFTGMVAYNMAVGLDAQGRYQFPADPGGIKPFIDALQVHQGDGTAFAAGIRGTMNVFRLCEIRDFYFGFASGPAVNAEGALYLPLGVSAMIGGDGYTKVGSVAIAYSHPERYFSFSMTLDRIDVAVAAVGGSLGFEYSPRLFGVYLGYPETLAGNIGIYHVGIGVGFRIDEGGDSLIRLKFEFGYKKDVNISIVYLHAYLYAGVDGAYYFADDRITLELYLKGGVNGGIRVGGKPYNIINFHLDARGKLEAVPPYTAWDLHASCKVSYSLDLWVTEIEGSVSASFDTRLG